MDEALFDELFEKTEAELEVEKAEVFTRWTFDTGSDEDKQRADAIEIFLEARKRTGLRK